MMRKMSDQRKYPHTHAPFFFFLIHTFAFVLRRSRSPWQGGSRISPREWTAFYDMFLWLFQFAYLKKLKKQLIQIKVTSMLRIMFYGLPADKFMGTSGDQASDTRISINLSRRLVAGLFLKLVQNMKEQI